MLFSPTYFSMLDAIIYLTASQKTSNVCNVYMQVNDIDKVLENP